MSTVAVTGATGFVGGTVAAVLTAKGHDVVCLVRRDPGADFPWKTRLVDMRDVESLALGLGDCDAVAHLAIFNDFHAIYADRRAGYDGFVGLTRRVVDAANLTDTQVGYVSTDWVFDGTGHLVDEEEPPNPVNFYGFLKAASELVVLQRARAGFVARVGGVQGLHQTQAAGPRSQDVGFGYFVSVKTATDARSVAQTFQRLWRSKGLTVDPSKTDFGGDGGILYSATADAIGAAGAAYQVNARSIVVRITSPCADGSVDDYAE